MIFDDEDHTDLEEVDDPDGDPDLDLNVHLAANGAGEWLGGLRRAGLPVSHEGMHRNARSTAVELEGSTVSPALQNFLADTGSVTVSAELRTLLQASIAPSTRAAYEDDWLEFATWARTIRHLDDPLDADPVVIAEYVMSMATGTAPLAIATIRRRLAAISFAFGLIGRDPPSRHPLVARTVKAASRVRGTAKRQAAPLRLEAMRHLSVALPIVRSDVEKPMRRDQLLIALGWASALRASELVGLDVEDLTFIGDADHGEGGVLIRIRRSKTDQTAAGEWVAVPYASQYAGCPVRLAMAWTRRVRTGPLFRHIDRHGRQQRRLTADSVSRILRTTIATIYAEDPAPYSSHSLRAGFVTEARAHGVPDDLIARHTRHTRPGQRRGGILNVYDRPSDLLERPALDREWW